MKIATTVELGDPKTLKTMDKVYTTAARSVNNANSWLANARAA